MLTLVSGEGFVLDGERVSPQQAAAYAEKLSKRAREVVLSREPGSANTRITTVGHRSYWVVPTNLDNSFTRFGYSVSEIDPDEHKYIREVGVTDTLADARVLIAAHALEL